MWLSFTFKASGEQQEMLIALLDSIGFAGFEQKENELIAVIPQADFSEEVFLETIQPLAVSHERKEVPGQNWNEEWEKNFQPIIIENKIAVRASFHSPIMNVAHEIIIDPKMSFGTGHHATTEMMMRLMMAEDFSGKPVLDFGCGTGILSILASKLGASSVLAIDNDVWAVENGKENIKLNKIENAEVIPGDSVPADKEFDFILANITREVILQQLPDLTHSMKPNGILLLSGFLNRDSKLMKDAVALHGLQLKEEMQSGEWAAAIYFKR